METFFTVTSQTKLFLWAFVLGCGLGIFYDIFRCLRLIIKHNNISVIIEDAIYIIIFSLSVFTLILERARGELKAFMFVGAIIGMILYILTIGNFVIKIMNFIILFVKKITIFIYNKFFKKIITFISKNVKKLAMFFIQNVKKLKRFFSIKQKHLKSN